MEEFPADDLPLVEEPSEKSETSCTGETVSYEEVCCPDYDMYQDNKECDLNFDYNQYKAMMVKRFASDLKATKKKKSKKRRRASTSGSSSSSSSSSSDSSSDSSSSSGSSSGSSQSSHSRRRKKSKKNKKERKEKSLSPLSKRMQLMDSGAEIDGILKFFINTFSIIYLFIY